MKIQWYLKVSCILVRTAHQRRLNLAAVVIMNDTTISLVGQNNNIIVMDSHLHGQLGAMVGLISIDKIEQLLIFVKQL